MKRFFLLHICLSVSALGGEIWAGVPFAEVRAYAWSADPSTAAVILPGITLNPDVINKEGAPLTAAKVARLRSAVTGNRPPHGKALCYSPHNAFVFYNAEKRPVAYVELCFSCLRYTAEPQGTAEAFDLIALAKLFEELKLPMGEYLTFAEFKKHFVTFSK